MLPDFKFHHIGIATTDIDKTAEYYLDTGFSMTEKVTDPVQNVKISFLTKDGMPRIELLEPAGENSPVSRILSKSGAGPYHLCYEVDDIEAGICELKKKHFIPLSRPVQAIALDNRLICFLYNADVGLIEILQK
ncbi:MAG: VOC family protein [Tannerella sp.]|jgi:methylmalonyl-CoA/ethylmalonyl-CoA epimerase|nr:VOC family protein [Tannerella sp.]